LRRRGCGDLESLAHFGVAEVRGRDALNRNYRTVGCQDIWTADGDGCALESDGLVAACDEVDGENANDLASMSSTMVVVPAEEMLTWTASVKAGSP